MKKTNHWYRINKEAFLDAWDTLSNFERRFLADDVEQKSWGFKTFINKVNSDTEGRYNSPSYYLNDPYSFKYSYYNEQ
jgi:hypothetical protein